MRNLIAVLIIVTIYGCADMAKVAKESVYINHQVTSGNVKSRVVQVELTSTELQIIQHAENSFNHFKEKWKVAFRNPDLLLISAESELTMDYLELKQRYAEVDDIVRDNWKKYDQISQMELLTYQAHALSLDNAVSNLLDAESRSRKVATIMEYAATIGAIIGGLR